MASDHAALPVDLWGSRFWTTVSATAGLVVAACVAAVRRRRARALSAGAVSADWLRRYERTAGQQGDG
jgi:hypothetical protein